MINELILLRRAICGTKHLIEIIIDIVLVDNVLGYYV